MKTVIGKLKVESDWWKSEGGFFGRKYAEADNSFEGFLSKPKDMSARLKDEVTGVIKLCKLKKGDNVLDAPCGYGRHSLGLASKGMKVIGVDINSEHLALAQQSLEKSDLKAVKFINKDIRTLTFKDEFDAVVNMFYSFGFFEDFSDDVKVIENFYKSLKKGGKFLMHTFITLPKIEDGQYKRNDVRTLASGNKLELFRDYDYITRR